MNYFQKGCFMISFDLKSSYHHIDINTQPPALLGFPWKSQHENSFTFYCFTVLPFGLSTAPFVLTKCIKPLQKHWRNRARAQLYGYLNELEPISVAPVKSPAKKNAFGNHVKSRVAGILQAIQLFKSEHFHVIPKQFASFTGKIRQIPLHVIFVNF